MTKAARIGLANSAVPADDVLDAAIAMARTFLENSWFTLRADKMLVNGGLDRTLADGVRFERENSPGRGPDLEERTEAVRPLATIADDPATQSKRPPNSAHGGPISRSARPCSMMSFRYRFAMARVRVVQTW